jgi:chemotaxis protein methyltransferase CheR
MTEPRLRDREFELFRGLLYETAGINLTPAKKALVTGRLAKRVKHFGFSSFAEYFNLITTADPRERQIAVDLLTTNETFFFRESKHFDFLRDRILPGWQSGPRRVWSAASSSGEEAYTLAMVMADHCPTDVWEIVGTDISTRVLERARAGQYPMERADNIPRHYLTRHCLRGIGNQDGTFIVCRELRARTAFLHRNLKGDLADLGFFDLVMLRNVLIYFDHDTKREIVARVLRRIKSGGYLMVGHSESLNGVSDAIELVQPSIYRKP